jgi:hypothetical protein
MLLIPFFVMDDNTLTGFNMTITEKRKVEPERPVHIQRQYMLGETPSHIERRGSVMRPPKPIPKAPGEKAIQFSGTSGELNVTFSEGNFKGVTVKLIGERLIGGKFWAYNGVPFSMIAPEKRELSALERTKVVAEIKKFSDRIEFESNCVRPDITSKAPYVK